MDSSPPGKRAFFKYASPDTVRAILRTKTVRYSSPLTFNDPFDLQSGLHFDFDIDALPGRIIERLGELASAPEAPPVDLSDVWGQLVLRVREHFPTHGFPRERWEHETSELFAWLAGRIKETQHAYREHWRQKLLPGVRVFCVSEDHDNLLMWAHYGRDHTGAVFEFWSLPDEDNPLSVARRVQYGSVPPSFFSETEFLDDLLSIKKLDVSTLYRRYAYCKSDHWNYEREWRVWYPLSEAGEYEDMPIRQSEFRALYLGCRMRAEVREEILALVHQAYPDVRVLQAAKDEHVYQLRFTEV